MIVLIFIALVFFLSIAILIEQLFESFALAISCGLIFTFLLLTLIIVNTSCTLLLCYDKVQTNVVTILIKGE